MLESSLRSLCQLEMKCKEGLQQCGKVWCLSGAGCLCDPASRPPCCFRLGLPKDRVVVGGNGFPPWEQADWLLVSSGQSSAGCAPQFCGISMWPSEGCGKDFLPLV